METYEIWRILAPFALEETRPQREARQARERQEAYDKFIAEVTERACRRSVVPIEICDVGETHLHAFYPVRLGREPGTIKLRMKSMNRWGMEQAKTIHIDPSQNEKGYIETAWAALSAHKRMAFIAAIADRTVPKAREKQDGL